MKGYGQVPLRDRMVQLRTGPDPATVGDKYKSRDGPGQSTAATFNRKNHSTIKEVTTF